MKPLAAVALAISLSVQAQTPPVRISSGVMAGQLVHRVWPRYPEAAKQAHISGSVVLHLIIGEDGIPHDITVVSGPEMLRQAWGDAVKQWAYKPYLLNGRPVPVETTITVNMEQSAPYLPSGRVLRSSGEMAGMILEHPAPHYPQFTAKDHVSGASTFHVIIGRDGHVLEVDVIGGPPPRIPYHASPTRSR